MVATLLGGLVEEMAMRMVHPFGQSRRRSRSEISAREDNPPAL